MLAGCIETAYPPEWAPVAQGLSRAVRQPPRSVRASLTGYALQANLREFDPALVASTSWAPVVRVPAPP